jgi:GTPase SAR1 family protein
MPNSTNEPLADLFNKRFNANINPNKFHDKFIIKDVVLGSTSKFIDQTSADDDDDIELSEMNKALHKIFHRTFSMWEAGRDKKELYKNLYAFPSIKDEHQHLIGKNLFDDDSDDLLPVNLGEKYTDYFLTCLCAKAKSIKDIESDIYAANYSRYFLIGDVGTGKTTFLNYIFSRHYEQLQKRKIMWIRVDLTKSYHGSTSLEKALSYQIARVVRKNYYDKGFELDNDFLSLIENKFKPLLHAGRFTEEEIKYYIDEFIAPYNKQRSEPYHFVVQQAIKEYVENKFSMIYVYDGLDRIRKGDDFDTKLSEIQDYIIGSEKSKHLYVFVMRTSSHAKWLNSYLIEEEKYRRAELRKISKTFILIPPKLSDIVNRRINVLCKTWDSILNQHKHDIIITDINSNVNDEDGVDFEHLQELMNKYSWIDSGKISAYYDVFLRFIYRGLALSEKKEVIKDRWDSKLAYTALKNVVGNNFRILLDVLSLLHKCFLQTLQNIGYDAEDISEINTMMELRSNNKLDDFDYKNYLLKLQKILAKHYRVTSILLRKKTSYVHHNDFYYDSSGEIKLSTKINGDNIPFIFSVFRGVNVQEKKSETYHLLAKIRVLQLLSLEKFSTIEKIVERLSVCFGYKPKHLQLDINELVCMNMITPIPKKDNGKEIYYEYEISRVGEHAINKLIYEFSYLRIVLGDIFIPIELASSFYRDKQYSFKNAPLMWVISQIPRISNFVLLINETERQERMIFESKCNCYQSFDKDWAISNKIALSFVDTASRILQYNEHKYMEQSLEIIGKI